MKREEIPVKKIRILMVIGLFHPYIGGAEKECQKMAKGLREKGADVTVLTQYDNGLPEHEEIDGIPVYRKMKGWHWFEITYMLSVLRFLLKHRRSYDVIQCFGLYLFIPPLILMRYLFGKRVVARLECSGQFGDFWRINQLSWGRLVLACAKRCNRIVYISKEIRAELLANRFDVNKLIYLTNSVDIDRFKPPDVNGNNNGSKIACFVGRLEEQKGLEYLIRAMVRVRDREEAAKLFIVGGGHLRPCLEELCKDLGLERHVFLVGATDDVLTYYQMARVFVLPSLSEGLPLSLLEAMSCGLPVVVTSVGGNNEVVGLSEGFGKQETTALRMALNGIVVEPRDVEGLADAMLGLLQNDELSHRLGKESRRMAEENFSQGKTVQKYLNLYQEIMQ